HHVEKPRQATEKPLLLDGCDCHSVLQMQCLPVFLASVSLLENDEVRIIKLQDYFQLQLSPI
ncbi:hypothetical protein ACQP3L_33315, partial [Escherichia coli]